MRALALGVALLWLSPLFCIHYGIDPLYAVSGIIFGAALTYAELVS